MPLFLSTRILLLSGILLAPLFAETEVASSESARPDFHAFLHDVSRRATEVEVLVSTNPGPANGEAFRIFRSPDSEDIRHVIALIARCEEPPLRTDSDIFMMLPPFPVPEFRYFISFRSDSEPLLQLHLIDPLAVNGLPSPWFRQATFKAGRGEDLWEFLRREHQFSPGAPQSNREPEPSTPGN